MTVRSREMVFAGGMAVFPGGRVDPADYELAQQFAGQMEADEAAHQIAAIRETLEETGLGIGLKGAVNAQRSEEHTSELQSLMRISYAVFCLKKKTKTQQD